jgi:hypothetical protein
MTPAHRTVHEIAPRRVRGRGFTLVEALTAMTVTAIVGSVSSAIIFSGVGSYRDAAARSQIHEESSTALARLGIELRQIPLSSSAGTMAPQISSVTPTSMAWSTNYSLSLSGTQLMFTEAGGSAAVLLNNVTSFSLQCFDESNAAMSASLSGAACYPIRRIRVSVTISRDGQTDSLASKFFIRSTAQGGAA